MYYTPPNIEFSISYSIEKTSSLNKSYNFPSFFIFNLKYIEPLFLDLQWNIQWYDYQNFLKTVQNWKKTELSIYIQHINLAIF